jgi:hypothetical protein
MQRANVSSPLSAIAFDFFFWFSRFEFALKEGGYLRSHKVGAKAEPGWERLVDGLSLHYTPSTEATLLLAAAPERQVVGVGNSLTWAPLDLEECKSELEKVVLSIKTVRNNLFHGGKHGAASWDDAERTTALLLASLAVLDQLAALAGIDADYNRSY